MCGVDVATGGLRDGMRYLKTVCAVTEALVAGCDQCDAAAAVGGVQHAGRTQDCEPGLDRNSRVAAWDMAAAQGSMARGHASTVGLLRRNRWLAAGLRNLSVYVSICSNAPLLCMSCGCCVCILAGCASSASAAGGTACCPAA